MHDQPSNLKINLNFPDLDRSGMTSTVRMTPDFSESTALSWDTTTGNRFSHYSPEDHSATVWIAAALTVTYVVGVLLVRVLVKWRMLGWDDGLLVISTV